MDAVIGSIMAQMAGVTACQQLMGNAHPIHGQVTTPTSSLTGIEAPPDSKSEITCAVIVGVRVQVTNFPNTLEAIRRNVKSM